MIIYKEDIKTILEEKIINKINNELIKDIIKNIIFSSKNKINWQDVMYEINRYKDYRETNFDDITQSPEKLAEFLDNLNIEEGEGAFWEDRLGDSSLKWLKEEY